MSENKEKKPKARLYVKLAGGASLITGILCYVLKAVLPERIDESGVLHESFFLLPLGLFFILCGLAVFVAYGICALLARKDKK